MYVLQFLILRLHEKVDKIKKFSRMGIENVKNVILVLSGKGGVGKSSVSVQIARGFLAQGLSVGMLAMMGSNSVNFVQWVRYNL